MAWDDAQQMTAELHALGNVPVSVTVKSLSEAQVRSQKANAYYWSTVLPAMVDYLDDGTTADDIHDAMCTLFLPNQKKRVEFFNRLTGESLTVETESRRSSKLSGRAFYEFVEKVRLFFVENYGVETKDPDPEYWRHRRAA